MKLFDFCLRFKSSLLGPQQLFQTQNQKVSNITAEEHKHFANELKADFLKQQIQK